MAEVSLRGAGVAGRLLSRSTARRSLPRGAAERLVKFARAANGRALDGPLYRGGVHG